jgi:hypothetical protein
MRLNVFIGVRVFLRCFQVEKKFEKGFFLAKWWELDFYYCIIK